MPELQWPRFSTLGVDPTVGPKAMRSKQLIPDGLLDGCQTARHELDAGDVEPSNRAFDRCLDILCQAAIAVEPGDGALHHPPSRQQNEALSRIRPLDDLDAPVAEAFERPLQFVAGIAAVGEHMTQPGIQAA